MRVTELILKKIQYLSLILYFGCRGLFIIDDKGNLRQITINDLPVGRSVDETLRLVQAFQFTDKHGEGKKPIKTSFYSLKNIICSTLSSF